MQAFLRRVSACFAGGAFGGLVNSIAIWLAGQYGWAAAMGVAIAPDWTPAWLYPRLVWGGIWGLLFVPAIMTSSLFWRGLIYSLAPTLVQLLIIFPTKLNKGMWGLDLGQFTPLYVLLANALWGWATAVWMLLSEDGRDGTVRYR